MKRSSALEPSVPSAHYIHMTTNPDSLLTREEFASLREIARGLIAKKVLPSHAEKLLKLRLIAKPRFEYVLTEAGESRLAGK